MARAKADGVVFLPEMTDDARLKSDLLPASVNGGDAVRSTIETLEPMYKSHQVLLEKKVEHRDLRICRAILTNDQAVEITTIALRDDSGWVDELIVSHSPVTSAKSLANALLRQPRSAK